MEDLADRPGLLEDLLRRYRATGDPGAAAALFDATAPRLFRLALTLAPDPASAEDAVQDTFLAALEAARRGEPIREALPWLTGILKHKVLHVRERVRKAPDPLRLEPRIFESDPPTEAARAEEIARVRAALEELPEPYREVAILRWRYGVEPAAIAHARGVPPGTVRSLLSRAAEKLRSSLGALAAVAFDVRPPRGLDAVRDEVLRAAASPVPASTAAASSAGTAAALLGGALVAKKTVAAVAALALLLLGGWIAADRFAGDGDGPAQVRPAPAEIAAAPSAPAAGPEPQPAADSTAVPPATSVLPVIAESPTGAILVTVQWHGGSPAEGVVVQAHTEASGDDLRNLRTARTDKDGTALFERLPPGTAWIRADRDSNHGDRVQVGPADAPAPFLLVLREGITIDGLVVDRGGAPVSGATVWMTLGGRLRGGFPVAVSSSDGTFRLRDVVSPCEMGARAPGHAPSQQAMPMGAPGSVQRLTLALRGPGSVVTGRVLDPSGAPVAGALVKVGSNGILLEHNDAGESGIQLQGQVFETDAEGAFRAEGVRPGVVPILAVAKGFAPSTRQVAVEPGGAAEAEIRLGPGAALLGRVVDGSESGVEKATVTASDDTGAFHAWALTDADGAYRIEDLPPGDLRVEAKRIHVGKVSERRTFEAGAEVTWDPRLAAGLVLAGRVLDAEGSPVKGWYVSAETSGNAARAEDYYARGCGTDGAGRFRFEDVPEVPIRLVLVAPGTDPQVQAPAMILDGLRAGGDPLEIRIPASALPSAFLEGRILGPDGKGASGAKAWLSWGQPGHGAFLFPDPETGRLGAGPLPPVMYAIAVRGPDETNLATRELRLEAGRTFDLGDIAADASGSLALLFLREDGKPVTEVRAVLVPADGALHLRSFYSIVEGSAVWSHLPPGRYLLQVDQAAPMPGSGSLQVEVPRDGRGSAVVDLRPSLHRYVRCAAPAGGEAAGPVRVTVRDPSGAVVAVKVATAWGRLPDELADSPAGVSIAALSLPEGTWQVEGEGARGERGSASVVVTAADRSAQVVDIALR